MNMSKNETNSMTTATLNNDESFKPIMKFNPFTTDNKTLTLIEYIDKSILEQVYCNNSVYKEDRMKYFRLLNNLTDENSIMITYKQNEYNGASYGRFYPVNQSMCGTFMWRKVRATLFKDTEFDIDMKSAHQSIVEMLITKHFSAGYFNDNFPLTRTYIYDRDRVISQFDENIQNFNKIVKLYNQTHNCDYTKKDIVKAFHTINLYGGSVETWMTEFNIYKEHMGDWLIKYLTDYPIETKNANKTILSLDTFQTLIKDFDEHRKANKEEKKPNRDGSLMSLILQNEETKIVTEAIKWISRFNDLQVTVYAYDGFQLRTGVKKNDEMKKEIEVLLNNLNKHINKRFNSGNIIQFVNKPFSQGFTLEELNNTDNACKYLLPYFTYTNCDQLSKYVEYIIQGKVLKVNDEYYFYNSKFWELSDKEYILSLFTNKVYSTVKSNVMYYLPATTKINKKLQVSIINTTSDTKMEKAFNRAFSACVRNKVLFDNDFKLLNCNNGTINLDTFELLPHNANDLCSKCVPFDAPFDEVDGKRIISKQTHEKVFDVFLEWFDDGSIETDEAKQIVEYLLWCIGKSLHGVNFIEKAIVLIGRLSRNGKTTTMDIVKTVLNDYVADLNLSFFTTYDKGSDRPHPELLALQGARIIRIDEAGGDEEKIIPKKFKRIVGGDPIHERNLFSKKIVKFKNSGILFFLSNYQLHFTTEGNDTSGKLVFFDYNCLFADKSFPGWDNKKNKNHKPIKEMYKQELLQDKNFLNKFFATILALAQKDVKVPDVHLERNKQNVQEVNSVAGWCDDNLVYDKNDTHFKETDWIIENNKVPSLTQAFYKKKDKDELIERQLTLDFLYDRYKKDVEEPVSKKNFNSVIKLKYKDFIPSTRTRLFGGRKDYIREWSLKISDE